jgi:cytochrome c oxidase assembly factor CtaG
MHASLEAVLLVPVLAAVYAVVLRPRGPRAVAAAVGLLLVAAFFATPLQGWATETFLWAHLLQNVVMAEWAPLLLVLAVPPDRFTRLRVPLLAGIACWLGTYLVWHLPWVYDTALAHQRSLLHLEHLTYLLAGLAFWWPIVRNDAASSGTKALYLFSAFVLASPIGLVLALFPRPIYDFYVHAPRTWGPAPLADQQIAGVTMALEEAAVFFSAFAFHLLRFLQEEQRDPELFRRAQHS